MIACCFFGHRACPDSIVNQPACLIHIKSVFLNGEFVVQNDDLL